MAEAMRITYPSVWLDALCHQIYLQFEVLAIDNAKKDECGALLAQGCPEAQESKWASDDH